MIKTTRLGKVGIAILLSFLILLPLAQAFAVSAPYWSTKPLTLLPGQTTTVTLSLQNMVGSQDVRLRGMVEEGKEFAKLIDQTTEYFIPFGQKDVPVTLQVSVPTDIPVGQKFTIGVSFSEVVSQQEGMVQMGGGVKASIPIEIEAPYVPPEEETSAGFSPLLIGIVIIGALLVVAAIVFLAKKKRKAF